MRTHSRLTAWGLISPWIVGFGLFGLFPFLFSLWISFRDYSPIRAAAPRFVGLDNYAHALHDPAFWSAMNPTTPLASSTSVTSAVAPFLWMIFCPVRSRTPNTKSET